MPDPLVGQMALSATSSIGDANIQALQTEHQNRRSRKWAEQMYQRQKQDNLEFWNMQNQYNSPEAQMQRFMDAGLNPNLIYGRGESGNAGPINTPDVQPAQFKAPDVRSTDAGAFFSQFYDLEIKDAQADAIRAQTAVAQQDALLRVAQIAATEQGTARSKFDLDFDTEFRDISSQIKRESLRQLSTGIDLSINRDLREQLSNGAYLREAAERILASKQQRAQSREEVRRIRDQRANIRSDTALKEADLVLRKNGIYPGDPWYTRIGVQILEDYLQDGGPTTTTGNVVKEILQWLK